MLYETLGPEIQVLFLNSGLWCSMLVSGFWDSFQSTPQLRVSALFWRSAYWKVVVIILSHASLDSHVDWQLQCTLPDRVSVTLGEKISGYCRVAQGVCPLVVFMRLRVYSLCAMFRIKKIWLRGDEFLGTKLSIKLYRSPRTPVQSKLFLPLWGSRWHPRLKKWTTWENFHFRLVNLLMLSP